MNNKKPSERIINKMVKGDFMEDLLDLKGLQDVVDVLHDRIEALEKPFVQVKFSGCTESESSHYIDKDGSINGFAFKHYEKLKPTCEHDRGTWFGIGDGSSGISKTKTDHCPFCDRPKQENKKLADQFHHFLGVAPSVVRKEDCEQMALAAIEEVEKAITKYQCDPNKRCSFEGIKDFIRKELLL